MDELYIALRLELGDAFGAQPLLTDEQLRRAIARALLFINRDFGCQYVIEEDDSISPPLSDEHRELLLLRALAAAATMLLVVASQKVSFSSGDKRVSHREQVQAWSRLVTGYLQQYNAAVEAFREESFGSPEPLIYNREVQL